MHLSHPQRERTSCDRPAAGTASPVLWGPHAPARLASGPATRPQAPGHRRVLRPVRLRVPGHVEPLAVRVTLVRGRTTMPPGTLLAKDARRPQAPGCSEEPVAASSSVSRTRGTSCRATPTPHPLRNEAGDDSCPPWCDASQCDAGPAAEAGGSQECTWGGRRRLCAAGAPRCPSITFARSGGILTDCFLDTMRDRNQGAR